MCDVNQEEITDTKFCYYCDTLHPITTEWWLSNDGKMLSACKKYRKDYRNSHKERIRELQKQYVDANKEELTLYRKRYNEEHKEEQKLYSLEYNKKNEEKIREANKKKYIDNKDRIDKYNKEYFEKNKVKIKQYYKEYEKEKLKNDPIFKLKKTLRSRISHALKGRCKPGSAVRDMGCTPEELKIHLELQFEPGMTWENHGIHGWTVDHIIPLDVFDLTDREQFLKANHYTNLQPLWAADNSRKNAKLNWTKDSKYSK